MERKEAEGTDEILAIFRLQSDQQPDINVDISREAASLSPELVSLMQSGLYYLSFPNTDVQTLRAIGACLDLLLTVPLIINRAGRRQGIPFESLVPLPYAGVLLPLSFQQVMRLYKAVQLLMHSDLLELVGLRVATMLAGKSLDTIQAMTGNRTESTRVSVPMCFANNLRTES